MPLSLQNASFPGVDPSSFTTNTSGFRASTVGTKSMMPLPELMNASLTYLMDLTMNRRSCSGYTVWWCLYSSIVASEPMPT